MTDDAYDDNKKHEAIESKDHELVELQEKWSARIEKAEKDAEDYRNSVKRSLEWLRLDEKSRKKKNSGDKLNIAYSNYEVLRSAIYSRAPKTVIQPRFGGGPNRANLNAVSEVVERAIESQNESSGLHGALCVVRDDMLKAGRGIIWLRYEADFQEMSPEPNEAQPDIDQVQLNSQTMLEPMQIKSAERVCYDVISWQDFLHGRAKRWSMVPWVARRERMTRKALKERFNIENADIERLQISFGESKPDDGKNVDGDIAEVFEIWCKESRKVYFVVRGASQLIEPPSDVLIDVRGFFPCPEPAMSVCVDGTIIPIPDVMMIEDQLLAVDELTGRIRALEKSLKVRGFYEKGATDTTAASAIEDAVRSNDDRQMLIPVSAWAANGQSKLNIVWLPIDMVVSTIDVLVKQRKEAIELVYQVSGISDVMRGATQASETLGAQQIKDRWGGVRVRDKQDEMRRIACDAIKIASEIICELFDPKTIAEASVYGFDEGMMELLRNDKMRSFMIDVETDSTVQSDEQEDKQRRQEFTQTIGALMKEAVPLIEKMPEAADFVGSLVKFNVRGFRAGRELENDVDKLFEALKQKIAAPPPQPAPDPAMQRNEVQAKKNESDAMLRKHEIDTKAALTVREQNMKFSNPLNNQPVVN